MAGPGPGRGGRSAPGGSGPGLLRKTIRTALAAGVYVLVARLVLGVAREVSRQLPLPPLFMTLLAGLLVLGLLIALTIAWSFESVGRGGPGRRG